MLTAGSGPVDGGLIRAFYVGSDPVLVAVARGFTFFGEWWLVIALSVATPVTERW